MKKIHIICNVIDSGARSLEDFHPYQDNDTMISLSFAEKGSEIIASDFHHTLAGMEVLKNAIKAEKEEADAIVIESMGDTALRACREMVNIPVVACSQTAMHFAAMFGYKFSIIVAEKWHQRALLNIVAEYNLKDRLASIVPLNIRPMDIAHRTVDIQAILFEAIKKCIEQDFADTLIFGGTYFMHQTETLKEELKQLGHMPLMIDPLPLSIEIAKHMVTLNLSHSKIAYPSPPFSKIVGYEV